MDPLHSPHSPADVTTSGEIEHEDPPMSDLIDEDPPADETDPEPQRDPIPPAVGVLPPMGNVERQPPELELGYREPWVSLIGPPETVPPPEPEVERLKRYYAELRADLLRRVAEIELLLGFVAVADDLAVRVAKLEKFLGVKA